MQLGLAQTLRQFGQMARRTWRYVKDLTEGRNILGFLVFLCIAIAFWFSQTFKEKTTATVDFKLEIQNVPKNIIFTSDIPQTVSITLGGRGFSLLQYAIRTGEKKISVDYADLTKMGGIITIDNYVWRKAINKTLPADITYTSIVPSTIEIYYSMGDHKQVPVVFDGKIQTTEQHILCGIDIKPQYVDIYAPSPQFDTIRAVYVEPIIMHDIADTLNLRLPLQAIKGVKMVPDTVDIQACVDLLTSKTLRVPIYCENIPANKTLRTFPLMADVTFQVSATMFPNISTDDFIIVVDYGSISPNDTKCRLQTRQVPTDIYNVKVTPAMVDYVIEQDE